MHPVSRNHLAITTCESIEQIGAVHATLLQRIDEALKGQRLVLDVARALRALAYEMVLGTDLESLQGVLVLSVGDKVVHVLIERENKAICLNLAEPKLEVLQSLLEGVDMDLALVGRITDSEEALRCQSFVAKASHVLTDDSALWILPVFFAHLLDTLYLFLCDLLVTLDGRVALKVRLDLDDAWDSVDHLSLLVPRWLLALVACLGLLLQLANELHCWLTRQGVAFFGRSLHYSLRFKFYLLAQ